MDIKDLIRKLEKNKHFAESEETQDTLRKFVLNKSNPLEDRFNTWKVFCDKIDEPWAIKRNQYKVIGIMIDSNWPWDYDRYREYTFEDFLIYVEDYYENKDDEDESLDRKNEFEMPTVEEFKEMLIETNFGSFIMDW